MRDLTRSFAPLFAAATLCACQTPPAGPRVALPATPAAFKEASAKTGPQAPTPAPRGAWWQVFGDPQLDTLIAVAERGNTNLEASATRVAHARALLQGAESARSPSIGAAAGASRQGGPLINAAGNNGTLVTAALTVSYEADLFGRLAQAANAAALDVQTRDALLQSTRLLVQADVAQTYLALRMLDSERTLARCQQRAWDDSVQLTEGRWRNGSVSELTLLRLKHELSAHEAETLALDRRRAELEHALAGLVGETATQFRLAETADEPRLPVIPAGIPSEVLARRPDVAAARAAVLAAQARAGQARKAWLPSLSLTASGGQASGDLAELLRASTRAWGLGAVLALPVFDGGRREAGVRQADADLAAAEAAQRAQVLTAFREVEDQLSALRLLAAQAEAHERAVAAAGRAVEMTESRWQRGLASQLELLDARRSDVRSRREALQVQALRHAATVALIRALGGGWPAPG